MPISIIFQSSKELNSKKPKKLKKNFSEYPCGKNYAIHFECIPS